MGNQEAKADKGKPRITLVPTAMLFAVAEVREYGCKKYGDPDREAMTMRAVSRICGTWLATWRFCAKWRSFMTDLQAVAGLIVFLAVWAALLHL